MKVILLKDVGGVGQRNAVKDVSDGYALNYLIPRGLAEQATAKSIARLELLKKQQDAENAQQDAVYRQTLEKLQKEPTTVNVRINDQGRPYQRVSPGAIAQAIETSLKIAIPKDSVTVNTPITAIGRHSAKIKLGPHEGEIPIDVRAL